MIPLRRTSQREEAERTSTAKTEGEIALADEALFANDTFYLAFAEKDVEAMSRLWAKHHPTICIHPGWPAIHSRDKIVESWRRILTNPDQPGIDFYNPVAHEAGNVVLVTCYEELRRRLHRHQRIRGRRWPASVPPSGDAVRQSAAAEGGERRERHEVT